MDRGDIHSKVGTKHAAVKTHPEKYLSSFGETPALSEQDISLAEEYLVKVTAGVMTKTRSKTFDDYLREKYTGGSTGINDLPPTSTAIRTHILRASYSVYIQVISMDDPPGVRAIIPFRATAPGDAAYNAQSVCFDYPFV